jgi:hypothetical protein
MWQDLWTANEKANSCQEAGCVQDSGKSEGFPACVGLMFFQNQRDILG